MKHFTSKELFLIAIDEFGKAGIDFATAVLAVAMWAVRSAKHD